MKALITCLSFSVLVLFAACKKENNTGLNEDKAAIAASKGGSAGLAESVLAPNIVITLATGTCNASPFISPSPGVRITLEPTTYNYYFATTGSRKIWLKKNSSSVWSSYIIATPVNNPFSITYGSSTPALGAIAAGTPMTVAVTAVTTATCPSTPCGGGAVSNLFTFNAANCNIIDPTKTN